MAAMRAVGALLSAAIAADRAAREVGVVERAVRALGEADRAGRAGQEGLPRRQVRQAVRRPWYIDPDAVARVVAEEQRVLVGGRERVAGVEGEAGDRRRAGRAGLARDDLLAVVVGEVRRGDRAGALRVERLAAVEVQRVVGAHARRRPRSTASRSCGPASTSGDAVDLLPRVPADVAGPDLARARAEGEAERVAEAVGDDPAAVRVGVADRRVAGGGRAGVRVHAQDRAVERGGLRRRACGRTARAARRPAAVGGGQRPRPAGRRTG